MNFNKYVLARTRMRRVTDQIKHIGTIERISNNTLHVKMLQSSACSGCHAAKLCQSSESKEKEIEVVTSKADQYRVGQTVMLIGSVRQGLKATVWAYMLPILILVAVLFGCFKAGCSENISAMLALGSLAPYFFILWLFRDKFKEQFSFSVE